MTGLPASLAAALDRGPVVLDGGLGTLLESRGNDVSSDLWSAQLLWDDPDEIRAAHEEFFTAGAQIATTASYQVSYPGVAAVGRTPAEADRALAASVRLAQEAREGAGLTPDEAWIAASVGPYGAYLADGSEYTGAYGLSTRELRAWHRPRMEALAGSGADLLALETVPSLAEVAALCAALADLDAGMPAWLSVTVKDGRLRSGESLTDAFALAADCPDIVAVGVNCCDAVDVTPALRLARTVTDLPLVAYPNSGEVWDARARAWSGTGASLAAYVGEWADLGASLIGGCCRVTPAEIRRIASALAGRWNPSQRRPPDAQPALAPVREHPRRREADSRASTSSC
ncbi:homocysteine S-methyltransferase [Brevibacterium samyangense]|uniref:homocysteine S-methyltransferase n=1 Tax=Brevibacterium samyangense TaxID=366888 RepID=UPI0031D8DAAC